MKVNLLDLAERVGWTFVQAFAGSIAAGGTAMTLQAFDWRAALAGGGTAALICLLKVLGVTVSGGAPVAAAAGPVDELQEEDWDYDPEEEPVDPAPAPGRHQLVDTRTTQVPYVAPAPPAPPASMPALRLPASRNTAQTASMSAATAAALSATKGTGAP